MGTKHHILEGIASSPILEAAISIEAYCPIDFSTENPALQEYDLTDPSECQYYIDRHLKRHNAQVAYGGYLEKRDLYKGASQFALANKVRNIHLGMDFWCGAGTIVQAPVSGKVHSFANNAQWGDYGPTIILAHQVNEQSFYTLYGHLSLTSLQKLRVGQEIRSGQALATLGTPDCNVGYAPHLHFQVIFDLQGKEGDYPGVAAPQDLDFYSRNCPDPNLLLQID